MTFRIKSYNIRKIKGTYLLELLIKKRKSIRQYNKKKVSLKSINEIIDVARYSPSGKNRQPWKIKVLEAKDKETLSNFLFLKLDSEQETGSLEISINAIRQCDKVLLLFNPYSYNENEYSNNKRLMDIQSIGAFIQNILLLATEKGISSLWLNDICFAKNEIEKYYVNDKMEVIAAVCFGYTNKVRTYNIRKCIDEIFL